MRSSVTLLLVVLLVGFLQPAPAWAGSDKELELTRKLAREPDPVKKAKIEIRLAHLKLRRAKDTRGKNGIEDSLKLLEAYSTHIDNAWDHLKKSGRVAQRKPQGFKELEIELREDGRYLDDLKRTFSLADRELVEKIIAHVESVRVEVLKALFPAVEGKVP